ncbi:MAG TPA: Cys-tRNA(Pro) deacylase [Holophagaceae bacterium]|nr:Cys-tRNA(Pro) deacylase [Holophagaceae bacterium]
MSKAPSTNATRLLKGLGIAFTEHLYRYEDHGGTAVAARELGVEEHAILKTLVMEDDKGIPFIILMHGDREVSLKALARQMGARSVQPCKPETASKHSGYLVGGTSPFGARKAMPIFVEATVLDLPRLWINGGSRGFLLEMAPEDLAKALLPIAVKAAL